MEVCVCRVRPHLRHTLQTLDEPPVPLHEVAVQHVAHGVVAQVPVRVLRQRGERRAQSILDARQARPVGRARKLRLKEVLHIRRAHLRNGPAAYHTWGGQVHWGTLNKGRKEGPKGEAEFEVPGGPHTPIGLGPLFLFHHKGYSDGEIGGVWGRPALAGGGGRSSARAWVSATVEAAQAPTARRRPSLSHAAWRGALNALKNGHAVATLALASRTWCSPADARRTHRAL